MSCEYTIGSINFPENKRAEVEALIEKFDIAWMLCIESTIDTLVNEHTPFCYLEQKTNDMGYSDASDFVDSFLPELANILKDTEFDGQVIDESTDYEPGTIVIVGGKVSEYDGNKEIIELPPDYQLKPGEKATVPITAEVIGIGGQRVVVTKVKG
ncbi:MAG: hypothetical protein PHG61_02095 [Candidatus Marinimicrobia bacterium]|jgi:hypothetical protein|nr:hypothetical protein [Candidatus Neomarinimicrobiota bacterium]